MKELKTVTITNLDGDRVFECSLTLEDIKKLENKFEVESHPMSSFAPCICLESAYVYLCPLSEFVQDCEDMNGEGDFDYDLRLLHQVRLYV